MGEVSIEDVGTAESVIQRMINERRVLESAQQVLQTYRMVKAELEPLIEQHKVLTQRVQEVQAELDSVNAQRTAMKDRVEKEVSSYRDKRFIEIESELKGRADSYIELIEHREKMLEDIDRDIEKWESEIEEQKVLYSTLVRQVEELRKEHGVIVEAVGKAAALFSGAV
jgi:DNA repair exonuclease SbcCD ATPase subunit